MGRLIDTQVGILIDSDTWINRWKDRKAEVVHISNGVSHPQARLKCVVIMQSTRQPKGRLTTTLGLKGKTCRWYVALRVSTAPLLREMCFAVWTWGLFGEWKFIPRLLSLFSSTVQLFVCLFFLLFYSFQLFPFHWETNTVELYIRSLKLEIKP